MKYYCDSRWLLTLEEQRGIDGQNVVDVILPIYEFGSARVNHNAELCIYGLNPE